MDLLVAEDMLQRLTGPNGEYLPDATSDKADPNDYTSGSRYIAHGPYTNWSEKARLDAIDAHRKKVKDANTNGQYWTVDCIDY